MFSHIGGKIKTWAVILSILGIAASVIYGGVVATKDVLAGVLIIVFGSLGSWVSSFLLYGFGQLVENSDKIVEKLEEISKDKDEN